jgi:alpha-1,3-mannosyltransferase
MLKIAFHRPRINLSRTVQAAAVVLAVLSLFYGSTYLKGEGTSSLDFGLDKIFGENRPAESVPTPETQGEPVCCNGSSTFTDKLAEKDGNATLLALAPSYITAIMDPEDRSIPRLECPRIDRQRYEYLQTYHKEGAAFASRYYFALNLHQNLDILPRLMNSVVEVIRFLGPGKCVLSIVEGGSDDGTFEILKTLRAEMGKLGTTYHFVSSPIDTRVGDRIGKLAELRNLALAPLLQTRKLEEYTVVFLNDVAICPDDILELVHQLILQEADMTCAMDWTYVGQDPTFYDVWIARDMKGESFFNIPPDGNWNSAWNLFWDNADTQQRYHAHLPFQVFSCWNGAVAFTADVLGKVKFRSSNEGECLNGEPTLFCKELWAQGYGKIAVVPSVNLVYSDEQARKIKALKGFVGSLVEEDVEKQKIKWEDNPPEKVKCITTYENQIWVPWDQTL